MKSTWSRSMQMTLCAAAICAMGAVNAQTPQPPASTATPQSSTQTPAQASPSQANGTEANQQAGQDARRHDGRKAQRHHRAHRGEHRKGERPQVQRGKYANPHEHEAAAARAEERAGRLRGDQGMDQYQRNALARCEVFRETQDRQSCVNRVRSAEVSGSVRDGGVLREYTEQVPVNR